MLSLKAVPKLESGYAESSSRRYPREPKTVVVGSTEIGRSIFQGEAIIDGRAGWLCWRDPVAKRYYFQYRPW